MAGALAAAAARQRPFTTITLTPLLLCPAVHPHCPTSVRHRTLPARDLGHRLAPDHTSLHLTTPLAVFFSSSIVIFLQCFTFLNFYFFVYSIDYKESIIGTLLGKKRVPAFSRFLIYENIWAFVKLTC